MTIEKIINNRVGEMCSIDRVSTRGACEQLEINEPWMKDSVEYWEGV